MAFDRELIEAKLALDLIASADMPSVAVEGLEAGLEAGLDGPAIRRLAVLERPTFRDSRSAPACDGRVGNRPNQLPERLRYVLPEGSPKRFLRVVTPPEALA
jgi:hypothetical protein